MGQTGVTPYNYIYITAAVLLLVWLALTAVTVTARLRRTEKESRQMFK